MSVLFEANISVVLEKRIQTHDWARNIARWDAEFPGTGAWKVVRTFERCDGTLEFEAIHFFPGRDARADKLTWIISRPDGSWHHAILDLYQAGLSALTEEEHLAPHDMN
jgi:hypothetical protein